MTQASEPLILSLEECEDASLVGGKAAGLGRLLRHGFRVPPGLCLTTAVYQKALRDLGIDPATQWTSLHTTTDSTRDDLLSQYRLRIATHAISQTILLMLETELHRLESMLGGTDANRLWAVRSSASNEDTATATFAGVYRTNLGVIRPSIASAITECWASLWTPAACAYHQRSPFINTPPAMAVVLQPLLSPLAAGVAYSSHPVTGRSDSIAIDSVLGLAEPLVSGRVTPDHFIVQADRQANHLIILERNIAEKTTARVPTRTGLVDQLVPPDDHHKPSLEDSQLQDLASLAKEVERVFGRAVDIEWALDEQGLWLLQARPISAISTSRVTLSAASSLWSRANFRETLPEIPSPLGLSFLRQFMEANILDHYRELGCHVPPGLESIRTIRGRPYINVSLLQSFITQLGGDPTLLFEQMGGQESAVPAGPPRLPWWTLLKAGISMEWKVRRAARQAPLWFAEMKQMRHIHTDDSISRLSPVDLYARMDQLGRRLYKGDMTFAIVAGVSQGFQALTWLLQRRTKKGWRPLLNASLQGLGNVISAKQILWLIELAEQARQEPRVRDFLSADPWEPSRFRDRLAGTRFLRACEDYLQEYGHRGIGESDVMSPRFAELPDYVLGVIKDHFLVPPAHSATALRREQESTRREALQRIRTGFGWRWHYRALFTWWHRRLARYLALREANRHHLMYFTAAVRQLALMMGERLVALGVLQSKDDIFFLTADETRAMIGREARDWKSLGAARRAEREQNASHTVPDFVCGFTNSTRPVSICRTDADLNGLPISVGYAEGPVRLVCNTEDVRRVMRGDIIVVPVIDPGMAPILGLAAGLVIEMGGILSHGAIIAREYGIPAVANVNGATRVLKKGERVAVDAGQGKIRRLDR